MGAVLNYKTKQGEEVLACLKSKGNAHITVREIVAYLNDRGIHIGVATIYRHLDRLIKDNVVKKYIVEGSNGACFEYMHDGQVDIHFKCANCGGLTHFRCEELEHVRGHMMERHRLNIDLNRTVFYGFCDKCLVKSG